jgi:cytochrome c oxidase assembly protein subunit 11
MSVALSLRRMPATTRTGLLAGLLALSMVGLGFAAVPLYRMFCQATGFAGTTQRSEGGSAPGAVVGKVVSVRFDSNVAPKMKWDFRAEKPTERVAIGAREMIFYTATNLTDRSITGHAAFNVTPEQVGKYFSKIECFCFKEQTLKPHETVRMPVVFYVDPKFLTDPDTSDISEITLSYTFFPVDSAGAAG